MAIAKSNGFSVKEVQLPILSSLGLVKEDTAMDYYRLFPTLAKDSLVAELEASGKIERTVNPTFGMWVDHSKQRNLFTVEADVTVTASAPVTVTVASYTDTAETLSAPAVGLFFVENSSGVEFEVTAVSKVTAGAHTATIKPTKTGVTVTIPQADAEFISIGRPTVQESSFQQDGEYSSWGQRKNSLSYIRTNKAYSDITSMVHVEGRNGDYMSIDRDNMNQQHIDAKEFQLVEGDVRNNVTSTGNRNTDAKGIIPLVKQYGTTLDGGGSGAVLNEAFFDDMTRAIEGNGFADSYKGLADSEAIMKVQKFLKAQGDLNINLNVQNGDRSEIQVIFDYSTNFIYNGIDFSFKKYDYWNTARLAGANNAKNAKRNQILLIPQGGRTSGGGEFQDYLRLRYLDNNLPTDDGLLNKFDTDGALFGKNTTRNAELSLTSYMGVDAFDLESFMFVKLAN